MIRFGTGGWREVIGDGFTRENVRRIVSALCDRMAREGAALVEPAAQGPNPVTQDEMHAGSIELF